MINRLSNPINRNRSAAKISKVMSSSSNTLFTTFHNKKYPKPTFYHGKGGDFEFVYILQIKNPRAFYPAKCVKSKITPFLYYEIYFSWYSEQDCNLCLWLHKTPGDSRPLGTMLRGNKLCCRTGKLWNTRVWGVLLEGSYFIKWRLFFCQILGQKSNPGDKFW